MDGAAPTDALVDELIAAFPAARFQRVRKDAAERHVLVVGTEPADTARVARLLDAHPQASAPTGRPGLDALVGALPGETVAARLEAFDDAAARALAATYRASLGPLPTHVRRLVDRHPSVLFHVGWAALSLPGVRIVCCRRDPGDTRPHLGSLDAAADRLLAHWLRVLPRHTLAVDHRTLVQRPDRTARRMIAFLDLPWDARCRVAPAA